MKKAVVVVIAAVLIMLMFANCIYTDPLIVSHQYAGRFAKKWTDDGKRVIEIGLDDDTIGYIEYTSTPYDPFSDKSLGNWRIDNTTLTVFWDSSLLLDQTGHEEKIDLNITYTYANSLNDSIVEQGKEAIQKAYHNKNDEHLWYVSDKYLCLDDLILTRYKSE